jgi:hypothetical protein
MPLPGVANPPQWCGDRTADSHLLEKLQPKLCNVERKRRSTGGKEVSRAAVRG